MTRSPTEAPRHGRRRLLTFAVGLFVVVSLLPRGSSATIEEQRARLPPPAECPDKVTGTWAALQFNVRQHSWYDFTLVIRRTEPVKDGNAAGPIEGEITSHYWYGEANQDKPPTCTPGGKEMTVKMPGTGTVDATATVDFGSTTYTIASNPCGNPGRYYPDHFTGKIDSAIQEFQSVNNDGGPAVNEPVVFRRIRCLDAPFRNKSEAPPPAFAPPKRRAWSCGK